MHGVVCGALLVRDERFIFEREKAVQKPFGDVDLPALVRIKHRAVPAPARGARGPQVYDHVENAAPQDTYQFGHPRVTVQSSQDVAPR